MNAVTPKADAVPGPLAKVGLWTTDFGALGVVTVTGMAQGFAHTVGLPAPLIGLALVILSGCGGSGAGRPADLPAIPTTSVFASPVPRAPQSPIAAADAVVHRYFRVINRLHTDMDANALSQLMTPSCPCQAQVTSVRMATRRGERYVDRVHIYAARPALDSAETADVLVDFESVRGGLDDAAGRPISRTKRHRSRWDFQLVRHHTHWLIDRIESVS